MKHLMLMLFFAAGPLAAQSAETLVFRAVLSPQNEVPPLSITPGERPPSGSTWSGTRPVR